MNSTTWRALSAAVMPMLTWSSRPAEEGMESTEAGWLSTRDSATRAAEVTWAIMKPELRPEFFARNGGSPLEGGVHQLLHPPLADRRELGAGDGQHVEGQRDRLAVEVAAARR